MFIDDIKGLGYASSVRVSVYVAFIFFFYLVNKFTGDLIIVCLFIDFYPFFEFKVVVPAGIYTYGYYLWVFRVYIFIRVEKRRIGFIGE